MLESLGLVDPRLGVVRLAGIGLVLDWSGQEWTVLGYFRPCWGEEGTKIKGGTHGL
jgi:hypothetical protein